MAYGDEQDFGQVSVGVDTGGGFDPSAGVAGGPETQLDSASAVSGMADILDQAADAIQSSGMVSNEGAEINTAFDPSAGVVGGPETQPSGLEAQPSVSLDALGPQPSLGELASALGVDEQAIRVGGQVEGGPESGPQDIIGSQVAGEEVGAEEVAGFDPSAVATPGEETAAFLSDFNKGMTAQSPEQGLVAKIDALQNQAAQLQVQAGGFDPSAAVPGGAPAQAIDPLTGAVNTVGAEGVAGGWGGNAGWNNPNTFAGQLAMLSAKMDRQERELGGISAVQKGYPQPSLNVLDYNSLADATTTGTGAQPSVSGEELALATTTGLGPQGPVISNVTAEQAALTASGGLTRGSDIRRQEELGITPSGGQGWVDPNVGIPDTGFITDVSMPPQTQATTLAPKYSGETVGYQTHEQMYPDHQMKAAMAGVSSIISMFDGTHAAWIESINKDMEARKIDLTHEINGEKTGKHSSADWKEYNDLFTVGEDGVPRDSNGVAMPGTEKQAQVGVGGVLQGLWGGILSGAEKIFKPSTSSGVVDPYANLGYPDYASGNIPDNIRQPSIRSEGDENRGDHPIDVMRSIYPWARSLANDVLFNAAKYPDYLRLLIEADKTGKELPLVVPEWILEGRENPNTNGNGNGDEDNWIANHPAMQTQQAPAGWGSAPWLT